LVSKVEQGLDDVSLMTDTSGTTGLPEGAMLSHRTTLFNPVTGVPSLASLRDRTLPTIGRPDDRTTADPAVVPARIPRLSA
jgi:acyl-CoA synthetase (AMP-forming)/AMP-acid ligase II